MSEASSLKMFTKLKNLNEIRYSLVLKVKIADITLEEEELLSEH